MNNHKTPERATFMCPGTDECRALCQALGRQGLDATDLGVAGSCGVPELLVSDGQTTHVNGLEGQLADKLASGLANHLARYHEDQTEREAIATVKVDYRAVFEARNNMFSAMLSATKAGQRFTAEELEFYENQTKQAEAQLAKTAEGRDSLEVVLGQASFDAEVLAETGLVFDPQMVNNIQRIVTNTVNGKPTLVTGNKGIAKTAAFKYVSRLIAPDKAPLIISGHGDMMTHELIGRTDQDPDSDELKLKFKDGKIIKAMREGRPVLLDEVNVADQSVMMRLNDIMLMRPGDKIVLQENGDEEIEIQPGFCIYMTANIGQRYSARQELDTAFKDRADIIKCDYPDTSRQPLGDNMPITLRHAFAMATDTDGRLSPHINPDELVKLARYAHVSQQLYSQPSKNVADALTGINFADRSALTSYVDDEPVMSDCITPRSMFEAIANAKHGNRPGVSLVSEIERLVSALDNEGSYNADVLNKVLIKVL